jgi:hypothetical protein
MARPGRKPDKVAPDLRPSVRQPITPVWLMSVIEATVLTKKGREMPDEQVIDDLCRRLNVQRALAEYPWGPYAEQDASKETILQCLQTAEVLLLSLLPPGQQILSHTPKLGPQPVHEWQTPEDAIDHHTFIRIQNMIKYLMNFEEDPFLITMRERLRRIGKGADRIVYWSDCVWRLHDFCKAALETKAKNAKPPLGLSEKSELVLLLAAILPHITGGNPEPSTIYGFLKNNRRRDAAAGPSGGPAAARVG